MSSPEKAHFDRAARWYDRLAKLVFGTAIRDLERSLLPHMNSSAPVCWIGGGTGEILPEILRQSPERIVDFVELSSVMRQRARNRLHNNDQVTVRFWESFEELENQKVAIKTLFLSCVMDMYPQPKLKEMVAIWTKDKPEVFVVDFVFPSAGPGRWIAPWLIPLMYRFFNLTIGIPVIRLPDWQTALSSCDYEVRWSKTAAMGMIKAAVWSPLSV